ncbi:hypothetical protein SSPSH_003708 [Salinisphaera shabanensis E1L3A]|uniref:Uncharacterized protein n=1 Tax=Salinisphaera shabanensis E1L3A TaxID=1033802 RepID=U2E0M9_9GAMM|nr:hypothetical protein [Salinisphaera shabanensis]ERJ17496.1 hypothetical protein SSPSH_003708 [Salinisphaera shabanensis E1L3A]
MAKRYSRRRNDGTVEYYDSPEEAQAARRNDFYEDIAARFLLAGFLLGGILAYVSIDVFGFSYWPKAAQFGWVVAGAVGCAAVSAALSKILYKILITLLAIGIVFGIGMLLWAWL